MAYILQSRQSTVNPLLAQLFCLCTSFVAGMALADNQPADRQGLELPPGQISTIDQPAPYRHLDWISIDELNQLPEAQRPAHKGICQGVYWPPRIQPDTPDLEDKDSALKAAADRYETDEQRTILSGNVIIQQGSRQLESDKIEINLTNKETRLEGNVRVRQQGFLLTGDQAVLNLNNKQLSITKAEYVIHANRIHGQAGKIYNDADQVLVFDHSTYTTCEPNSNAWQLEASQIRLNQQSGWGDAKHVVLDINGLPVLYIPRIMFPIDDRRQTGFLFPSIGSSDDAGSDIAVPYYINLAPNYDATLIPRYMSKRGEQIEAEFRYLNITGTGELGLAYLDADPEYQNKTRKLGLWKHKARYNDHLTLSAEYTRVSDQDYFRHLDTYLNTSGDTHLDQHLEIRYEQPFWQVSGRLQSFQTLDRLIADEDLPYRKIPQIQWNGLWPHTSGWQWQWNSEYVRFEHPEQSRNGVNNADRVFLSPGLTYRYQTPAFFFSPSYQLLGRYYRLDDFSDATATPLEREQSLLQSRFFLDTGLIFERSFQLGSHNLKQTLEPRIFYLYTQRKDQTAVPVFDSAKWNFGYEQLFRTNRFSGIDRISEANQLSLGLSTTLINESTGQETLRASIGQSYYFTDRKTQLGDEAAETADYSALAGKIEWLASQHLRFNGEINWDANTNNIDSSSSYIRYSIPEQLNAGLGYRYYDNDSETASENEARIDQTDFSFAWQGTDHWRLLGRWRFDLENHRSFDALVGVEYQSCCWSISLVNRRYLEEKDNDASLVEANQGIYLQFQLTGLGGAGNKIERLLEESIFELDNN